LHPAKRTKLRLAHYRLIKLPATAEPLAQDELEFTTSEKQRRFRPFRPEALVSRSL
jgi:hypothetical protein